MSRVLIAQAEVKAYRVPFFLGLRDWLEARGVALTVAYGRPRAIDAAKRDSMELDAPLGLRVENHWLLGERLLYQPLLGTALGVDAVIVEQANKHALNHMLWPLARFGLVRLAFWGHGRDLQAVGDSPGEWLKRRMLRVDWWFAYTRGVADYLAARGVPRDMVTVVQNSVDVRTFRRDLDRVLPGDLAAARARLGIADGDPVGLFCGALYASKRLDFIVEAARRVRQHVPGFHLLLVGAGPEEAALREQVRGEPWIHMPGRQTGLDKAVSFRLADVFLLPAVVGLAVLDAFAAGLPVVVTDRELGRMVEAEYVKEGDNGVVAPFASDAYAAAIERLLGDPALRARLAAGALASSERYSIEQMIANFGAGVLALVNRPRRGPGRWLR